MKSTIVFIFLLFSISAFAQQNKWNVGVVGGAGITAMRSTGSKILHPNPTIGFYTGVSAQYNFNAHFALHTELAFDRKGTSDKYTFTDQSGNELGKVKITDQLNYLTLPILFRASVGNKVKYFLQTGPYLSYLLNRTFKTSTNSDAISYTPSTNASSNSTAIDFGMSAGIGVVVPIKEKLSFSCELRGNYGLVSLIKNNNGPIKRFNESLNVLVGINYNIGK